MSLPKPTPSTLAKYLAGHDFIWIATLDIDGLLRGKLLSSTKIVDAFKKSDAGDLAFSSGVFGMDIQDKFYASDLASPENGCADMVARLDLSSYRQVPWDNNRPFFLLDLIDPATGEETYAGPRTVLKKVAAKAASMGFTAYTGMELEFVTYRMPARENGPGHVDVNEYLNTHSVAQLRNTFTQNLTQCYGLLKSLPDEKFFSAVLENSTKFNCHVEAFHAEVSPGAFEVCIAYKEITEAADRATLFKYATKATGAIVGGIQPSFMAKTATADHGQSGHIHLSMVNTKTGKNAFCRDTEDKNAPVPEVRWLSETGRSFLAGVLQALPDMVPMFAPTINSYKRLVPGLGAPTAANWALESRQAAIRLITPPTTDPSGCRMEIRLGGADCSPHLANAAVLAAGLRGVELKLDLFSAPGCPPPLNIKLDTFDINKPPEGVELPLTFTSALEKFRNSDISKQLFGDQFVKHYAHSRDQELTEWNRAITDWELRRYIQMV